MKDVPDGFVTTGGNSGQSEFPSIGMSQVERTEWKRHESPKRTRTAFVRFSISFSSRPLVDFNCDARRYLGHNLCNFIGVPTYVRIIGVNNVPIKQIVPPPVLPEPLTCR